VPIESCRIFLPCGEQIGDLLELWEGPPLGIKISVGELSVEGGYY
jgi:hypothetical protein